MPRFCGIDSNLGDLFRLDGLPAVAPAAIAVGRAMCILQGGKAQIVQEAFVLCGVSLDLKAFNVVAKGAQQRTF